MNFKELGRSGVMVPEVGLGTHRYTGGADALRKAIDHGASLIDTAESYGTESVVSEAVKGIRDSVIIATKIAPANFRASEVTEAADRSLGKLNTDYIDVYQLHHFNPEVPLGETVGAVESLVDAGKVRFIGVCNFTVAQLKRTQAALSKHPLTTNQVDYSLITRNVDSGLFKYCQDNGITIIAHSPLGRGLQNIKDRDRRQALPQLARTTGKTESQVAINWCLSHPNVITVPKSNSLDRMIENCDASGWRLTTQQKIHLERSVSAFRRRGPAERRLRSLARRFLPIYG